MTPDSAQLFLTSLTASLEASWVPETAEDCLFGGLSGQHALEEQLMLAPIHRRHTLVRDALRMDMRHACMFLLEEMKTIR